MRPLPESVGWLAAGAPRRCLAAYEGIVPGAWWLQQRAPHCSITFAFARFNSIHSSCEAFPVQGSFSSYRSPNSHRLLCIHKHFINTFLIHSFYIPNVFLVNSYSLLCLRRIFVVHCSCMFSIFILYSRNVYIDCYTFINIFFVYF